VCTSSSAQLKVQLFGPLMLKSELISPVQGGLPLRPNQKS
jgi:hypothetical protein